MREKIPVSYPNNDGGGFAESCQLEPGTTVGGQFLSQREVISERYKIRLRRRGEDGSVSSETPAADTALRAGDFLSCAALKAEGA